MPAAAASRAKPSAYWLRDEPSRPWNSTSHGAPGCAARWKSTSMKSPSGVVQRSRS
jgi:hypothetical protein